MSSNWLRVIANCSVFAVIISGASMGAAQGIGVPASRIASSPSEPVDAVAVFEMVLTSPSEASSTRLIKFIKSSDDLLHRQHPFEVESAIEVNFLASEALGFTQGENAERFLVSLMTGKLAREIADAWVVAESRDGIPRGTVVERGARFESRMIAVAAKALAVTGRLDVLETIEDEYEVFKRNSEILAHWLENDPEYFASLPPERQREMLVAHALYRGLDKVGIFAARVEEEGVLQLKAEFLVPRGFCLVPGRGEKVAEMSQYLNNVSRP